MSARDLARLTGADVSTITRFEDEGWLTASRDLTNRVLEALDRKPDLEIMSRPQAIAVARLLLGDSTALPLDGSTFEFWASKWRLTRILDQDNVVKDRRSLAFRAGRSASLLARPGSVDVAHDRDWLTLGRQLSSAGIEWANTGGSAANRLAPYADQPWPVFYVNEIRRAVDELGLKPLLPAETGPNIRILPFDGFSEAGRWQDCSGSTESMWFAAPWQVVMDCYAGVDRMPTQANWILDAWAITERAHG